MYYLVPWSMNVHVLFLTCFYLVAVFIVCIDYAFKTGLRCKIELALIQTSKK